MKYYETHFDDYLFSSEKFNLHPELTNTIASLPKNVHQLKNLIFYGPSGTGKYTQVLKIIKNYSPSELKYEKKMKLTTEKQEYIYKISDIHYEIDMSLLGCNSKMVWHEAFLQIVDIISVKQDKVGIILCKNFHSIHNELLDNFYSYIQHYNYADATIKIKFFILSEHVSFIPEQIIQCSQIINIKRPDKDLYEKSALFSSPYQEPREIPSDTFMDKITYHKTTTTNKQKYDKTKHMMLRISKEGIINTKEIKSFDLINKIEEVPKDIFNIVCDKLIENISDKKSLSFTTFRENLYDILTYNIDVADCIFYILGHFIKTQHLNYVETKDILSKTHTFLKYYNNNYRPIYHLESIMFYIINRIHKHG
uniref:ATPase AAA-type core domain-containing protein n=1 Tax=viral metagenome TaxID=1070528 RepID=A0A6C0B2M6_9ZZZZ